MRLLLFDIDGTLVLTGGAGLRGMTRAFEAMFGVPDALAGVPVAGRTDPAILTDVMARHAVRATDGERVRFVDTYLPLLAEEMARPVPERPHPSQHGTHKGPLPGVRPLVEALEREDSVCLGLLTGNYRRAAEIKLGYFGLWAPFRCGAFGDDAEQRFELVAIAVERATAAGCPDVARSEVLVIGDTPLDVECARLAGVRSLAVATGGYDAATLRAAGASHVVEDLTDTVGITAWLLAY
jgi:phosphoglycolate phosphatase-like HAD superfamily hydrolase